MTNRIWSIQYFRAISPISRPIADATHSIESIGFIITRIELASGITGESNLLAIEYSPHAIAGALRDLAPLAMEFDVWQTGVFVEKALAQTEYFGNSGVSRWAIGAINIAMWDAWGKSLGQPIWKILGACRHSVPVYGSGGWLSYTLEELLAEVSGYARRGFHAVKIKVGSPEPAIDIERLARVREAVGPHLKITIDANQGLDVPSALALARSAKQFDVHWFEEPISHTDLSGYQHLRRHTGISLAMGEREYDTTTLRELIRRNALDLWQPDILRLGGVEGWRGSAILANEHGLPVLPHYYKEYDVPLLCTIPNAYGAESFDWMDELVDHRIPIRDGMAHPLPGAGWGFSFHDANLTELGASS
jgi:L-alanine-DL-glutamate epimerase-like enolase superfamily enzyme